MHESLFSNSILPDPVSVLRLPMLPYSVGHEVLLWRTGNPLATYTFSSFDELPMDEKRRKLFSAAFICSRSWHENRERIRWPRLTGFFRRHCDTELELAKFRSYRESGGADFPTEQQPRTPGVPFHYFGAPDMARICLFLAKDQLIESFGYNTLFDFPLGLARQLYLTELECAGSVWVQNHHDAERIERAKLFALKNPESTFAIGWEAVQMQAEKWNLEHPETPVPLPQKPKGT